MRRAGGDGAAISRRTPASRLVALLAVLAILALVCLPLGGPVSPARAATSISGTPGQLLARLAIADERGSGYARSLFVLWIDADGDGCDTRREVLISESRTAVRVGASCALAGGAWRSAYDGVVTGDPSTFDIDHVVPLKEAWDSGAWGWDATRRRAFANDLGDYRSLRAVSASSNRAKGDRDPAQWLPPRTAFRCQYATEWIAVKVRWRLAVDRAERSALATLLRGCPTTSTVVVLSVAGAIVRATGGSTGGATATAPAGCDPNYGGWCVPLSTTDLDCSDIGHRVTVIGVDIHRLDGDGDGIGCDSYP